MANNLTERFRAAKYTLLFLTIAAALFLEPFMAEVHYVLAAVIFVLLLAVLSLLNLPRHRLIFCFATLMIAFFLECLHYEIPALALYAVFLSGACLILLNHLFAEKNVTMDTIRGGIGVYFLIGFLWAVLYRLLLVFRPESISFPEGKHYFSAVLYYSFTTLSSLGFGDIVPVGHIARNLTILEASLGPIYLAVFIARLVGLHMGARRA